MAIQSVTFECHHCDAQESYKVGHNDAEDSIEKALACFQGKTQIHIRSLIKKHKINHASYGFALFSCPECYSLFNPYTVVVEYDDIMLFKPFHKCGQCNSTLVVAKETQESMASYRCKQCSEKQLIKQ